MVLVRKWVADVLRSNGFIADHKFLCLGEKHPTVFVECGMACGPVSCQFADGRVSFTSKRASNQRDFIYTGSGGQILHKEVNQCKSYTI